MNLCDRHVRTVQRYITSLIKHKNLIITTNLGFYPVCQLRPLFTPKKKLRILKWTFLM